MRQGIVFMIGFLLFASSCSAVSSQPEISSQQAQLAYQYIIFESRCVEKFNDQGLSEIPIECALYTISQVFNIILIPLCIVLRVPQINRIIQNKSVFGLSYFGNNLELLMTNMTLAYGIHAGFTFWIYGQNILLSFQNIVILSLFFVYSSQNVKNAKFSVHLVLPILGTLVISFLFILQVVPSSWQQASIWLQLLIFIGARGSQIVKNFHHKTTQNLSTKTMVLTLFANFARTITIFVESPQSIGYLLNYLIPIFVNGIIVIQIFWYSKKRPEKQKMK